MTSKAMGESTTGESSRGTEHRGSHRFLCDGFAEIFIFEAGFLFRGEIRDISQTGCYIMTKVHLKLERLAKVDVLFKLKNREYCILARVMDVRPGKGVGLEFLFSDLRVEDSIEELLQTFIKGGSPNQNSKAAAQLTPACPMEFISPSALAGSLHTSMLVSRATEVPKISDMPPDKTEFITRKR